MLIGILHPHSGAIESVSDEGLRVQRCQLDLSVGSVSIERLLYSPLLACGIDEKCSQLAFSDVALPPTKVWFDAPTIVAERNEIEAVTRWDRSQQRKRK